MRPPWPWQGVARRGPGDAARIKFVDGSSLSSHDLLRRSTTPVEAELLLLLGDLDHVSRLDLVRGDKPRQGINDVPLHGPAQGPGTERRIRPLLDDPALGLRADLEQDRRPGLVQRSLVDLVQELLEDLLEGLAAQRLVNQLLVETIQELEGKMLAGGVEHCGAQASRSPAGLYGSAAESEPHLVRIEQIADRPTADVRGHEHDRAGEIDRAIVAEGEVALLQDAEQRAPDHRMGFLDLVEEHD